jgi:hypothetical protein
LLVKVSLLQATISHTQGEIRDLDAWVRRYRRNHFDRIFGHTIEPRLRARAPG